MAFPAMLTSGYNSLREYGRACAAPEGSAIDFTSDFVPLVPLGTPAAVTWIQGGAEVQPYDGTVYLSSPGLLRLVGVNEDLVEQTRALFAANCDLPAGVTVNERQMPARLRYLTARVATLVVPELVPEGGRAALDVEVDFLTLRGLPLEVSTGITLRRGETLLQCAIGSGGDENLIALSAYVARLEQR